MPSVARLVDAVSKEAEVEVALASGLEIADSQVPPGDKYSSCSSKVIQKQVRLLRRRPVHELKPHHLTLVRLAHTEKRLRHVGLVDHNLISRARAALTSTEDGTKTIRTLCTHA